MYFIQSLKPWMQAMGVAGALLTIPSVWAQGAPDQGPGQASTEVVNFRYKSALEGYQRYADSGIESWSQSNQTVREIGGWKAYAKEPSASPVEQKGSAHQDHSTSVGHAHGEHKR